MFTFNLNTMFKSLNLKMGRDKYFEPLMTKNVGGYQPPSPKDIRNAIEKLSRCPNCHFLIFDNYWSNEIEKVSAKVCSTCGLKL